MIRRVQTAATSHGEIPMSTLSAMRNPVILLAAVATCLSMASLCTGAESPSIAGRWITFDDDTKQKSAIVEIVRDGRHATGRIVEIFQQPGDDLDPVCETCPGPDRGRRIRGLTILTLEADEVGTSYRGSVLDPDEGRTYRCLATLQAGGKRLLLRGYLDVLGIEIFGREATWVRAD
jgi:uncharacterized protein (DUF2147 family)